MLTETLTRNANRDLAAQILETLTASPGTATDMLESADRIGWSTVTYTDAEYKVTLINLPTGDRYDITAVRNVRSHLADRYL